MENGVIDLTIAATAPSLLASFGPLFLYCTVWPYVTYSALKKTIFPGIWKEKFYYFHKFNSLLPKTVTHLREKRKGKLKFLSYPTGTYDLLYLFLFLPSPVAPGLYFIHEGTKCSNRNFENFRADKSHGLVRRNHAFFKIFGAYCTCRMLTAGAKKLDVPTPLAFFFVSLKTE